MNLPSLLLVIVVLLVIGLATALSMSRKQREGMVPTDDIPLSRRATDMVVIAPSAPTIIMPPAAPTLVIGPAMTAPLEVIPGAPPVVVQPPDSREPAITVAPQESAVITPPSRAVWDERGWTGHRRNGTSVYEGEYRVREARSGRERRFAGRIREAQNGLVIYIADPPPEIRSHPKGSCFQLAEQPEPGKRAWFILHWRRPAKDPDTALLYMEKVLDEAINHR